MGKHITDDIQVREARITGEEFHRNARIEVSDIDVEKRTVKLSFASEAPVKRYDYSEVLSMTREAADLSRLNSGGALLSDHDSTRQVGVIEKAWLGDDKRGHAIVRFSKRQSAQDEFTDVCEGIRQNVSFGYRIHEHNITRGEQGSLDTVTATRWEAFEISLVSIPADASVGVGRAIEKVEEPDLGTEPATEEVRKEETENTRGSITMKTEQPGSVEAPKFTREDEIMEFGRKFGADDRLIKQIALDPSKTVEHLRQALQDQYKGSTPVSASPEAPATEIGMTEKETRTYSIAKAIVAQADGDWSNAGFERECHETVAKKLNRQTGGFYVPNEVQVLKRDLSVAGGGAAGQYLVGTDHMPQSFIEILRNKMKMLQLGVQVMGGLVGNPSIPRQDGAATGYWVAEGVAPSEGQQTFGQLGLNPKTCGAVTEFTRQLLLQSAPSIDMLVMSDIAAVLARTVDLAIIDGTSADGQPTGILNTTGVTETAMAGASFAWADAVNFESLIAEANAPDAVAWLGRPGVRGTLKSRAKIGSTYPIYLVGEDNKLNGYNFETTMQMPAATLLFGDFSTVILGEWGILEIEANRHGSGFRAGNIEVRGLQSVDVAVRYPQAIRKLEAFA